MNTNNRNTNQNNQYEYDVAISFLSQDQVIAKALADEVKIFSTVFFFPKEQDEIAGSDGITLLTEIFRSKSRLVVILHREKWGKIGWTMVENGAIHDRYLKLGWDTILVVKLERDATNPNGFPDSRIYIDYELYGIHETIGAIRYSLERLGSTFRQETLEEKTARLANDHKFREKRKQLLNSFEGVNQAKILVKDIFERITNQFEDIKNHQAFIQNNLLGFPDPNRNLFTLRFTNSRQPYSLDIQWLPYSSTSLEMSKLEVREIQGHYPTSNETLIRFPDSPRIRKLKTHIFEIDYTLDKEWCWHEKNEKIERHFTSKQLAEHILHLFLNLLERVSKGEIR